MNGIHNYNPRGGPTRQCLQQYKVIFFFLLLPQVNSTVLKAVPYLDKKLNESFIKPACSTTTRYLSSVLMGWMDLVKTILVIGKFNKGV